MDDFFGFRVTRPSNLNKDQNLYFGTLYIIFSNRSSRNKRSLVDISEMTTSYARGYFSISGQVTQQ